SIGQLFSYGGNLGKSSFINHCACVKCQSRNFPLEFTGITRFGDINLRPGGQSLPHVRFVSCAWYEYDRRVRIKLANAAAQLDPGSVRQPIVQDVEVEISLFGQSQTLGEIAGGYDPVTSERKLH